jgi:kynurenine 3-monooxygenase
VRELCLPIRGRIIHSIDGTLITQPYSPQGHCLYCPSRAGLDRLLIHAVRKTRTAKLHFQEECAFVDVSGGAIEFKNKRRGGLTRIDGGYVIGADGSSSVLREALEFVGRSVVETRVVPIGYKEMPLTFCAEAEDTLNPEYLHVWARGQFFLIAFPNSNQSFTSLLFMPSAEALSLASLNNRRAVEEFLESEFPDLYYSVPDLAIEFLKAQPRNLKTIRCYPWVDGKFALLGDAAHTILFSYLTTYSTTYESIRRKEIEAELALRSPNDFCAGVYTRPIFRPAISRVPENWRSPNSAGGFFAGS